MARRDIHLVTFADGKNYTTARLVSQAQASGYFTKIHAFSPADFDKDFWDKHQTFLCAPQRGYGLWIWKFYFCARVLAQAKPDDIIVYMDSGSSVHATPQAQERFQDYLDILDASPWGILQFRKWLVQGDRTKDSIFILFDADAPSIRKTSIRLAGIFLLRKCPHSQFVMHELCALIDAQQYWIFQAQEHFLPSGKKSHHQHDQAVLAVLTKKLGAECLSNELEMAGGRFPLQLTRRRG